MLFRSMEEDDEEISENGSDNKINETQPLMAIPDIIDSDKEGLNSSATEDVQNFPSSSVNNENGTMTDHVNTDSFMPILFIVIIAIGIVIFKLS